jgi:hypothetical protein
MTKVALYFFVLSAILFGGDTTEERASLKGIKSVCVIVEDIKKDSDSGGLTIDQIQIDVELRLRKAGIAVADRKSGCPIILDVNLTVSKLDDVGPLYLYNGDVAVMQYVKTVANNNLSVATTWSKNTFGVVGSKVVATQVRSSLGDVVDKFLNAYLSVNPK